MRRRVYVEHLPPQVLAERSTIALLTRFSLEPIVALPPSRQTSAMANALAALARSGLRVGVWPLLTDEEGYWPSELNATKFEKRVDDAISFCKSSGARLATVAIDLEPPLEELRELMEGSLRARAAFVRRRRHLRVDGAAEIFSGLQRRLANQGIETIAAAIPLVVLDLFRAAPFWQNVLKTPATNVPWSVLSPMMYTTIVKEFLPSKNEAAARALLYAGASRLHRAVGVARASVSVGLVGDGKLGTEPTYASPQDLALDVGAARAAQIEDMALFALEGTLSRGPPEPWLEAFVSAPPTRPSAFHRGLADSVMRAAGIATVVGGLATKK